MRVHDLSVPGNLSRVSWKLSRTVLRGGTNSNVGPLLGENDRGEQFGVGRTEEAIRTSRDLPPSEIIARLYDAVKTFSNGSEQQDDLTAVIIKRRKL